MHHFGLLDWVKIALRNTNELFNKPLTRKLVLKSPLPVKFLVRNFAFENLTSHL